MIEVKSLSKRFGDHWVLKQTSWSVQKGRALGLLGPNGAGKTTTMKIMTGLICASEGEVVIDGHNILTEPIAAKQKIGYLPEIPPLYDELKVTELLHFVCGLKSVPKSQVTSQCDRVIEQLQLQEVAYRPIKNLSKGFRQRVGIAQSLLGEPSILILDEPSVGLDPHQVYELRNVIKSLKQTHTIVLSTHVLSEVQQICDDVVILNKGEIRAQGPLSEMLKKDKARQGIFMELAQANKDIVPDLKKLPLVVDVNLVGQRLELWLDSEQIPDMNLYINFIISKGCSIRSIEQKQHHLEDVFIEVTK
jgi:ABC-2 type transport system ATP-binding protein